MIAGAFHDRDGARIAHRETLARHAFEIGLARDRAIKHRVTDNDILGRLAGNAFGLAHHDASPRKTLADIIVGVAVEFEADAARKKGAEAQPRRAGKADDDGVLGQPRMAVSPGDFARQHGADGTVHVAHGPLQPHRLAPFDGGLRGSDQFVIERGFETMVLLFAIINRHARLGLRLVQNL